MHTINLAPPQATLDGRNLPDLIAAWLTAQRARSDLTRATVDGYADKLAWFTDWWQSVGPWCGWELSEPSLHDFAAWLERTPSATGHPPAYNTRNDILRRLKQMFRWAFRRGYTDRDFSPWVPAPNGSAPLRARVGLEELAALMAAAGRSACPVRDRALLALFIGTGVRRAEAVGLDVADLRMDADLSGAATVRLAKRVRGRDVRGRVVAFDGWTGNYLVKLLDTYPAATGPLFRVPEGDARIGPQAAYRIVRRAITRAGLTGKLQGPHDLRRHFATYAALGVQTDPLAARLLSRQLGHAQFSMTDRYVLHDAEDLRAIAHSPLAGVSQPCED